MLRPGALAVTGTRNHSGVWDAVRALVLDGSKLTRFTKRAIYRFSRRAESVTN
jgi:hypothetical protein